MDRLVLRVRQDDEQLPVREGAALRTGDVPVRRAGVLETRGYDASAAASAATPGEKGSSEENASGEIEYRPEATQERGRTTHGIRHAQAIPRMPAHSMIASPGEAGRGWEAMTTNRVRNRDPGGTGVLGIRA